MVALFDFRFQDVMVMRSVCACPDVIDVNKDLLSHDGLGGGFSRYFGNMETKGSTR